MGTAFSKRVLLVAIALSALCIEGIDAAPLLRSQTREELPELIAQCIEMHAEELASAFQGKRVVGARGFDGAEPDQCRGQVRLHQQEVRTRKQIGAPRGRE